MKTIAELCKSHQTTTYFDDGLFIGVYNHNNVVVWYEWTVGGYTFIGVTTTPQGADVHRLKVGAA